VKWLLWLYPMDWRHRYGDEFLVLLESQPHTPKLVLDVVLGAADARLRPQLVPQRSPALAGSAQPRRRRDRFDTFTPRSRSVLQAADEEARRLGHDFIGTEHLLLGLLHEPKGVAMGVLRMLHVGPEAVRAAVETRVPPVYPNKRAARGLTARTKTAIELSVEEANRLRHAWVGTEHLLLGLMREGEGVAADVLRELTGVDVDEVRRLVVRVLNEH
jgi:Clp amino terminal domain, pathogenicity island component